MIAGKKNPRKATGGERGVTAFAPRGAKGNLRGFYPTVINPKARIIAVTAMMLYVRSMVYAPYKLIGIFPKSQAGALNLRRPVAGRTLTETGVTKP